MKAFIHIGTEKTGTTTLQEFLSLNRARLAENGIAYLQSPGSRNSRKLATYCMNDDIVDDHVKNLGITAAADRNKWKNTFRRVFERELDNLRDNIHSVIISSEHFHSRLRTEDDIRKLHRLFAPFFNDITIIVYLRRQDQVAVSHYTTWCLCGLSSRRDVLSMNVDDHYYNYSNLLTRWANVFGQDHIRIRIFEKGKLLNGDLMQDFMHLTGMKQEWELVIPENKNVRLSSQVQDVLIAFNRCFPRFINNRPNRIANQLQQLLITELSEKYQGREKLPLKSEALDFYRRFAASNQKLADDFFGGEPVFSDDFSRYPETTGQQDVNHEVFNDVFCVFAQFLRKKYLFLSLADVFQALIVCAKAVEKSRKKAKRLSSGITRRFFRSKN